MAVCVAMPYFNYRLHEKGHFSGEINTPVLHCPIKKENYSITALIDHLLWKTASFSLVKGGGLSAVKSIQGTYHNSCFPVV